MAEAAKCVRTASEIVARMDAATDIFGTEKGDLLAWLPFDLARPHLRDGVTEEKWQEVADSGDPLDKVRDYLPFAWGKANDCRGLSAGRSVEHLKAWFWLAGFDLNREFDTLYEFYGKPCLVMASTIVGFDWRSADNGIWTNYEGGDGCSEESRERLAEEAAACAARATGKGPADADR